MPLPIDVPLPGSVDGSRSSNNVRKKKDKQFMLRDFSDIVDAGKKKAHGKVRKGVKKHHHRIEKHHTDRETAGEHKVLNVDKRKLLLKRVLKLDFHMPKLLKRHEKMHKEKHKHEKHEAMHHELLHEHEKHKIMHHKALHEHENMHHKALHELRASIEKGVIKNKVKEEKKSLREKLQQAARQGLLRGKILEHVKAAKILLGRGKIDRAKHQYSMALINYFKLPMHEEELYLQLKSLLKRIEMKELHPHWGFHHHAHKMLNLKRENKEVSNEALDAVNNLKKSLEATPELAMPKIQEKKSFFKRLFGSKKDKKVMDNEDEENLSASAYIPEIPAEDELNSVDDMDEPGEDKDLNDSYSERRKSFPNESTTRREKINVVDSYEDKLSKLDGIDKSPNKGYLRQRGFSPSIPENLFRNFPYEPPATTTKGYENRYEPSATPVQENLSVEEPKPRIIKVEKKYEKVVFTKEQRERMRKVAKLKAVKQKLKDELEMLN